MKIVLLHEYKQKKIIADNLEEMINNRYIEISDTEYERINNAIESYNNSIQTNYNNLQEIIIPKNQLNNLIIYEAEPGEVITILDEEGENKSGN